MASNYNNNNSNQHTMQSRVQVVQNNYTDYAGVPDDFLLDLSSPSAPMYGLSAHEALLTLQNSFPCKLHAMLEDMAKGGGSEVVSWCSHGRAFTIHHQRRFVAEVLPCYFRQTQYPSFQRQLNLYGFCRLTAGPDKGAYYHELFLRGKPMLALRIKRIRRKGQGPRKPGRPELEPNFYQMPFLPKTRATPPAPAVEEAQMGKSDEAGSFGSYAQPLIQPQLPNQPSQQQQEQRQQQQTQSNSSECYVRPVEPKLQLQQLLVQQQSGCPSKSSGVSSSLRSMIPNLVTSQVINYYSNEADNFANNVDALRSSHVQRNNNYPAFTPTSQGTTDPPASSAWSPYPEISRDCSSPLFWEEDF